MAEAYRARRFCARAAGVPPSRLVRDACPRDIAAVDFPFRTTSQLQQYKVAMAISMGHDHLFALVALHRKGQSPFCSIQCRSNIAKSAHGRNRPSRRTHYPQHPRTRITQIISLEFPVQMTLTGQIRTNPPDRCLEEGGMALRWIGDYGSKWISRAGRAPAAGQDRRLRMRYRRNIPRGQGGSI